MALDYTGKKDSKPPYWAVRIRRAVSALFDPTDPQGRYAVPPVNETNAVTATGGEAFWGAMTSLWKVHQTRKSIYSDIERMDGEDETVATALDIIADSATHYSDAPDTEFCLVSPNTQAQDVLNALAARLDLVNDLWQIARDCVKHGNEFREIIIDRPHMRISDIKQTVSYQIYPNTDSRGNKVPGWIVREDKDLYSENSGKRLEEWQIVPFIFGAKRGFLSVPPLAPARRNWVRLARMEDGMAIARLVRAYDRLVHKIPVKPEMTTEEIMKRIRMYKDSISKKRMLDSDGLITQLDSPLDAQTDFYLPDDGTNKGGVDLLAASNQQLGNLADITYHREKLLTRLQVPIPWLQIMSAQKTHVASGASKLTDVERQFARMLRRVQRTLKGGIRRVCDIELLLQGIVPTEELYEVRMCAIPTSDIGEAAEVALTYAQAAVYINEAFGMLPPSLMASLFLQLNPEQQELINKFFSSYEAKMVKAKMSAMEAASKPATVPAAANTRPPRGRDAGVRKGEQSISLDTLGELIYDLQDLIQQELAANGVDVPELGNGNRDDLHGKLLVAARSYFSE